jgi:hypothetical protein
MDVYAMLKNNKMSTLQDKSIFNAGYVLSSTIRMFVEDALTLNASTASSV